jgi:hypothetical protein
MYNIGYLPFGFANCDVTDVSIDIRYITIYKVFGFWKRD